MFQTSKEGQWAIFRTRAVLLVETANVYGKTSSSTFLHDKSKQKCFSEKIKPREVPKDEVIQSPQNFSNIF